MKIHGFTHPRFTSVQKAFRENMIKRGEIGAACCVYHHGEIVVDLWAGLADSVDELPWQEDTLAVVFSSFWAKAKAKAKALACLVRSDIILFCILKFSIFPVIRVTHSRALVGGLGP